MEQWVRNAIARIDVMQDGRSISRGTGTLIGQRTVLTALHVVADRHTDPPAPHRGQITLTFPGGTTDAAILGRLQDARADWVILECANPPKTDRVPMDTVDREDVSWETFGFPDANPRDGMVQSGTIEAIHAELDGVPVHQLFSKQAAAGDGAPVKGFSGAPVLVQDHIVGVLRFALMKDNRTIAGTLYACPTASVAIRRTAAIKLAHRSRWRWLVLSPLLLPIAVAAVLHFIPVTSTEVRFDARANRVGMILVGEQQLFAGSVGLDTLRAFFLREVSLPPVGSAGPRIVETDRLDLMTRDSGGIRGTITLDEFAIPSGTSLVLEQSIVPNEYIIAFAGPLPDLTLSVDGPVLARVDGLSDELSTPRLETIRLRPDSGGAELDLSPAAARPLGAIGPLRVAAIDFTHFRKGEVSHVQRSTILGGRLAVSGSTSKSDTVSDGELLALRGSEGSLRVTRFDSAGLTLSFEGKIDAIGSSSHQMPTQLSWLFGSQLPVALGVTAAYLLVTGWLIRRRMRKTL